MAERELKHDDDRRSGVGKLARSLALLLVLFAFYLWSYGVLVAALFQFGLHEGIIAVVFNAVYLPADWLASVWPGYAAFRDEQYFWWFAHLSRF
jgi:hypothetical protein